MIQPITPHELAALRQLSDARIAVVGDVILDEFIYGDSTRISPEAPVPVVKVEQDMDCLGGAANVARNIRDLGAEPILIGVVGSDPTADRVRTALETSLISNQFLVTDPARKTGIKTRVIARGQQLVRIDHESTEPIDGVTATALTKALSDVVNSCHAVIFSDYGKGVLGESLLPTLRDLVPDNVFTCVDPFPFHADWYRGFDAVTPNNNEARAMWVNSNAHFAEGPELARGLYEQLGTREIYVTLGKHGMVFCDQEKSPKVYPTRPRQVFDVSGAGDTVISMVAGLRGLGVPPETTCLLANRAAGLVVEKIGTATVSQLEILQDAGAELDSLNEK